MQSKSGRNQKQSRMVGRVAPGFLILLMTMGCSTFKSDYYMQPREGAGVGVREGDWADYAEIRRDDFVFSIRVPISGSTRHCLGPALFPVVPTAREWPQSLKLEMVIAPKKPKARIRLEPGKWIAHTRGEEFGKTFGKDVYKNYAPFNIMFFEGTGPRTLKSKSLGLWQARGKTPAAGQPAFVFTGSTHAMVSLPPYDNTFIDFELRDVKLEIDGKVHAIPSIQFKRKSRWKYTPWTIKVFDM